MSRVTDPIISDKCGIAVQPDPEFVNGSSVQWIDEVENTYISDVDTGRVAWGFNNRSITP